MTAVGILHVSFFPAPMSALIDVKKNTISYKGRYVEVVEICGGLWRLLYVCVCVSTSHACLNVNVRTFNVKSHGQPKAPDDL